MESKLTIFRLLCVFLLALTALTGNAQTPPTAKAAPNPAHSLSEAQKQAIERIRVESERRAAPRLARLAAVVSKIYENMLADKPDEALRAKLSAEMKEAAWALLAIKGQAIRETVNVLTPAQKQLVKSEMRKPGAPADLGEVIARTFNLQGQ